MEKPHEALAAKTLDPNPTLAAAITTAAAELRSPQNPNTPPSLTSTDDRRTEGQEMGKKKDSSLKPANATVAALEAAVASGAAADLEKKLRRAERFGVAVQLSEEEKRRTRAERFGTATGNPLQRIKNGGNLEEQKRKARAERFGLVVPSPADEEAKKKARLERFGQDSKSNTSEEEKMKARVTRFSQTSSTPTKTNGKKTTAVTTKEEPKS